MGEAREGITVSVADTFKDNCPHPQTCSSQSECDARVRGDTTRAEVVGARLVKHETPHAHSVERLPGDSLQGCYEDLELVAKKALQGFTAPELTLDRLRGIARRMMALGVR